MRTQWRLLEVGEEMQKGDEVFTSSRPMGWMGIADFHFGRKVESGYAPVRRRIEPIPEAVIKTCNINPPIPSRWFDWVAYFDGDEEGRHGFGRTEEEAIEDLREQGEP